MAHIFDIVSQFFLTIGYWGIGFMMFLEASFIPFPSEVAMIPAGAFAAKGLMNIYVAIVAGTVGSILGASLNYYLGYCFGRSFLDKFGKYLFLSKEKLDEMEVLFQEKGSFIVFFGRLIPVVRQYISFPPGVTKMNYTKFAVYTGLGSLIWTSFLAWLGYFYGNNQEKIATFTKDFKYSISVLAIIILLWIIYKNHKKFIGHFMKK